MFIKNNVHEVPQIYRDFAKQAPGKCLGGYPKIPS